jgi:hypothetical protein
MKTTFKIRNYKKTNKEDEMTEITFKDYRGDYIIKMPTQQIRHLIEELDNFANYYSVS